MEKPALNIQRHFESSEEASSDAETTDAEQRTVQLAATAEVSVTEAEITEPRKKRRKNQAGSGNESIDVDQPPAMGQGPRLDETQEEAAPLRDFPVPKLPEPPSKSVLARQGLDQSLVNAEVIDPTTTLSLQEENYVTRRLSARIRKRLGDLGITELFASKQIYAPSYVLTYLDHPVQTAVLPFLLTDMSIGSDIYRPHNPPRDVLASAPTGSGKTLAYVVPIVEARSNFLKFIRYIQPLPPQILSSRIVTRLRALVVLPTRDLVQQVKETFEACCKGTKLKVVIP